MPVLELANVEMLFLTVRALKGVSLVVGEGEIVGLIGPNGAGKTTSLNIASTLLRPTRGRVLLDGREAFEDVERSRALVGLMPQEYGVYDDMKAEEYLGFFCKAYGIDPSRAPRLIETSLEEMGLAEARSRRVSALSGGMRQKLFFVKTFLHSPRLVLLDEPFTALDPIACRIVREKIRREAARGVAFLIASHNLPELEELATRVIGIRSGSIVSQAVGAPAPAGEHPIEVSLYELRVEGDPERAAALLAERVAGCRVRRGEADWVIAEVPAALGAGEILKCLVEAGFSVLHFSKREKALLDFFERELGGTDGA